MDKAVLKLAHHRHLPGRAIEVWWQGHLVGCVYGADGPGIRFVTKYPVQSMNYPQLVGAGSGDVDIVEIIAFPDSVKYTGI